MSRIGNRVIIIPQDVKITSQDGNVKAEGPKGTLELSVKNKPLKIKIDDKQIIVERLNEEKHTKQLHGTINSLITGMIEGVTKGFKKELELRGVGYKAAIKANKLNLLVGFSHPIDVAIPGDIKVTTPSPTQIIVEGLDKQKVGDLAAKIRAFRKPEPYKGKGIRYKDEHVLRKVGKTAGK